MATGAASGDLIEEGGWHKKTPHEVLYEVPDTELLFREERPVGTSLKLSMLTPCKTLESFDFAFQPGVERKQVLTLATHSSTSLCIQCSSCG